MSQIKERFTIFLQYETLEDLLKVIVYSAQSALGLTPMLYYINYRNQSTPLSEYVNNHSYDHRSLEVKDQHKGSTI